MKIAITGGTGFIGQSLVKKCVAQGHEVRVLTRDKTLEIETVKVYCGDLNDSSYDFSHFLNDVDVLYHCAGVTKDKALMYRTHVEGTRRLVDASKGRVKLWIQLSSVGAYGKAKQRLISENSIEFPKGLYEETKTKSDEIIRKSELNFVILRPSIVFGKNMKNQSLFQLINMIEKNIFFYIGKPSALMNYVHVDDVVSAMILCSKSKKAQGNSYILSQNITIEKMVKSINICHSLNKKIRRFPKWTIQIPTFFLSRIPKFPLTISRINALTSFSYYNSSKIQTELEYRYSAALEEQIKLLSKKEK
jgi:nucleoside-diphosphate-sugar epimerase